MIDREGGGLYFCLLTYSNQSNNLVYFDDLKITHTKTNVVQYNEYYSVPLTAVTTRNTEKDKKTEGGPPKDDDDEKPQVSACWRAFARLCENHFFV
jgi:hypothetical protein